MPKLIASTLHNLSPFPAGSIWQGGEMKHIIYVPAIGEVVPDGAETRSIAEVGAAVGAMVADDFTTAGTVLYDSLAGVNILVDPASVPYFDGYPII